jgi:hypothetical protein
MAENHFLRVDDEQRLYEPGTEPNPDAQKRKPERSFEMQDMFEGIERVEEFGRKGVQEQREELRQRRGENGEPQAKKQTGLDLARDAAKQFAAAPDKHEAINRLFPQFNAAIKQTDWESDGAIKYATGSKRLMQPELESAGAQKAGAQMFMVHAMSTVDPEQRAFVTDRLNAYKHSVTDGGKQNVIRELDKNGLGQIAEALRRQEKAEAYAAPIVAREKGLHQKVERSVETRMEARELFAEALERVGRTDEAGALRKQGMDVFIAMISAEARAEKEKNAPPVEAQREPPPKMYDIHL